MTLARLSRAHNAVEIDLPDDATIEDIKKAIVEVKERQRDQIGGF